MTWPPSASNTQTWRFDLNNLAQMLKDTNRIEEAEPLMRRALEIDVAALGEQHPNRGDLV